MVRRQRGDGVAHEARFPRRMREMSTLTSARDQYLHGERRLLRYTLPWGCVVALPGIPVAAAHDVALPLAVVIGVVLSLGFLITAATWRQAWSWPVAIVLAVADGWPGVVWPAWYFFWGLQLLAFALAATSLAFDRRRARRHEARFGVQAGTT